MVFKAASLRGPLEDALTGPDDPDVPLSNDIATAIDVLEASQCPRAPELGRWEAHLASHGVPRGCECPLLGVKPRSRGPIAHIRFDEKRIAHVSVSRHNQIAFSRSAM